MNDLDDVDRLTTAWLKPETARLQKSDQMDGKRTIAGLGFAALAIVGFFYLASPFMGVIALIASLMVLLKERITGLDTKLMKTFLLIFVVSIFARFFLFTNGFYVVLATFIVALVWIWGGKR